MLEGLITTITEEELKNALDTASGYGMIWGILIGVCLTVLFTYLMVMANKKSFKMYLLQLNDTERQLVENDFNQLETIFENLARTNTRYFKKMYNEFCELKSYLKQRWMPN
jgi:hypothetical protein